MKKEDIIEKLEKIFYNKKYDYSHIKDASTNDNVNVICPIHGEFHKRLGRLLKGSGCPKCSGKARKTKDEFIKEANDIHKGKYDYSKTEYKNAHTKICIICPQHGEFYQTPTNHLNGNGCPICKGVKLSDLFSTDIVEFKNKVNNIHNKKYDYSKVKYKNNFTPIEIICPQHGPFYQLPHNHLQGKGCPICNESMLEKEIREELDKNGINYVYQWHLPWNKHFSLDFFIPSINMGIECQGIQHFEDGHFKNISLKEIVERDKYKADSCKKHGIEIIYYSKAEHDICIDKKEDIITLLKIFINKHGN